jgi:hypothetical protein
MKTPLEAIVRDITRPAVPSSLGSSPGARIYRGGHPFQARPETIRVLKERVEGARAMLAIEFEDTEQRSWQYVFGAVQRSDGSWEASGGAGGGGGHEPEHRGPWANFGGWGWPRFLCLGGRVYGEGVADIQLVDAKGRATEDHVAGGIALLLSNDPVEMPCRIELRDSEGAVVATQTWPPQAGERLR